MSNVEDSSSLEYLDESQYLEEDDHYTQFLLPPVPPQRHQSKAAAAAAQVIVEPEYTEADPGAASGTFRSLPGSASVVERVHCTSSLKPRKEQQQVPVSTSSLYSPVLERVGVSCCIRCCIQGPRAALEYLHRVGNPAPRARLAWVRPAGPL